MQYLGGKSRTAKQIGAYLNAIRKPGQPYWEPFVGAGWVLVQIAGGDKFASDANAALIEMWKALQNGWVPPDNVTEAEYKKAKDGEGSPELRAFIGFACSYAGKWFAGYARDNRGQNYAKQSYNSLLEKSKHIYGVNFFYGNFLECYIPARNCLIYCDPPYDDTTVYGATGNFNTTQFWQRVRWMEERGHTVIVSEYEAPDDFSIVWEHRTKTDMHTKNGKDPRIERLYRLGNHSKINPTLFDLIG